MPNLIEPRLRPALMLAALLLCAFAPQSPARAQAPTPASISGRVTDGERGATGVTVLLISNDAAQRLRLTGRTRTDAEGRFTFTNVAPGPYQVLPVAPTYIVEGLGSGYPPGRPLTLTAGEEVRDLDFRMEPGGVITGRVTDADGNPVVGEVVNIMSAEANPGMPRLTFDPRDQMTDDRGIYRLYGLKPGRYRVSVGSAGDFGAVSMGRRKLFRRTFYPDVTDQSQARLVEVRAGAESSDIDITVGHAVKTYKVAGRLVMADTGEPAGGLSVGYSALNTKGQVSGGYGPNTTANARGEFVTDGVAPGRYAVYVMYNFGSQQAPEFYSDSLTFEVADADVAGLVIKVKRGATISGVVSIEGAPDRATVTQLLSAVRVYPRVDTPRPQQVWTPSFSRPVNINPDGSFTVRGLPPGKLHLGTTSDGVKGLSTTRVDLNGADIIRGFDLAEGAQVTGVRIVLTYGTATLVGQTTYVNGAPRPGANVMAFARLVTQMPGTTVNRSAQVDGRGFFRIEGVPAGEYEVYVTVFDFSAPPTPGKGPPKSAPVRVVVGDGGEAKLAPVLDFH